jgi:hypothetical protein
MLAIDLIRGLVDDCIGMHITRRELLLMIGAAAATRCRGSGPPANGTGQQAHGAGQQGPESATVTLVVSGMV